MVRKLTEEEAHKMAEEFLDSLESTPDSDLIIEDPVELRAVSRAAHKVDTIRSASLKEAEKELEQAVLAARKAGYSWAEISSMIGLTKQAVQQRYGKKAA